MLLKIKDKPEKASSRLRSMGDSCSDEIELSN
jgi:hypothetical protein